jgi:hypothetical protein
MFPDFNGANSRMSSHFVVRLDGKMLHETFRHTDEFRDEHEEEIAFDPATQ